MKKFWITLCFGFIVACNGNADSKPTDLDHTDNDDTSAKKRDTTKNIEMALDTFKKTPAQ